MSNYLFFNFLISFECYLIKKRKRYTIYITNNFALQNNNHLQPNFTNHTINKFNRIMATTIGTWSRRVNWNSRPIKGPNRFPGENHLLAALSCSSSSSSSSNVEAQIINQVASDHVLVGISWRLNGVPRPASAFSFQVNKSHLLPVLVEFFICLINSCAEYDYEPIVNGNFKVWFRVSFDFVDRYDSVLKTRVDSAFRITCCWWWYLSWTKRWWIWRIINSHHLSVWGNILVFFF